MSVGAAGFIVLFHMRTTTVSQLLLVNATKHIALHNRGVITPKRIKDSVCVTTQAFQLFIVIVRKTVLA